MQENEILHKPIQEILNKLPQIEDFLDAYNLFHLNLENSFRQLTNQLSTSFWEEHQISKDALCELLVEFHNGLTTIQTTTKIQTLEVIRGVDKSGTPEKLNLLLKPGEITCIVGPTGAGKSRLLADIEWLANRDTPTQRTIKINGKIPDENIKNSYGGKLIAQITQNMNFVLDMDVESFLLLHAQSRFLECAKEKVQEVIELANNLSGERFSPQTPVTFLSGGQSRALMIADVACIGQAPIVLIDEIENAGVDKKKALELLINREKIVLMATHDPLLILQADKRIVIRNGGMIKTLTTNNQEKAFYKELEQIDNKMQKSRNFFRHGNTLTAANPSIE